MGVTLWFLPTFGQPAVGPIVAGLRGLGLLHPAGDDVAARFVATMLLRWLAAALLLGFVVGVERRPLSSVGIARPRAHDLSRALLVAGLAMPVSFGVYRLATGGEPDTQTARLLASLSLVQLAHLESYLVFVGSHIPGSGLGGARAVERAAADRRHRLSRGRVSPRRTADGPLPEHIYVR
ncbi:hypothetical protein B0I33_103465 [Prauserella shujinwangii]|uniref:Uncharacterized protein n=1 Tax=Prauserella shujinwangii TaxID=1453103 RepID=A0A2T0LZ85_9PSEU|nr:hypothetical protein [Prauserella shujinwangii]PRX49428.1 hypothetical protein B0I33_103465 [Prauserella shujinwangii]